jgi:hypothetical protein
MNVLNPEYFTGAEFEQVISNLWRGLVDEELLLTGSNEDAGTQVLGGAFQKKNNRFVKLWDTGTGSPIEPKILAYRAQSCVEGAKPV